MPIDPSGVQYLPIASIAPDTLQLCISLLAQCTCTILGGICALIVASTWKG